MKSKKINVKTTVIILLIGIIIGLVIVNLNNKNTNITKQELSKEQLETTSDNAYISMQTHLSELNAKQQEIDNMQNEVIPDYYYSGYTASTSEKTASKTFTATQNGTLIVEISVIISQATNASSVSISCTKNDETINLTEIAASGYNKKYAIIPYKAGDVITAFGTIGSSSNAYIKGICIMFYDIS